MNDDDVFRPQPLKRWDVYLLPFPVDQFSARPDQIWQFSVEGRTTGEARSSAAVQAARGTHWVLDVIAHGLASPLAMAIHSRARRAVDDAERQRFSRDGRDPEIARIIGSRPLGGG